MFPFLIELSITARNLFIDVISMTMSLMHFIRLLKIFTFRNSKFSTRLLVYCSMRAYMSHLTITIFNDLIKLHEILCGERWVWPEFRSIICNRSSRLARKSRWTIIFIHQNVLTRCRAARDASTSLPISALIETFGVPVRLRWSPGRLVVRLRYWGLEQEGIWCWWPTTLPRMPFRCRSHVPRSSLTLPKGIS
jgi:hypothetical protein